MHARIHMVCGCACKHTNGAGVGQDDVMMSIVSVRNVCAFYEVQMFERQGFHTGACAFSWSASINIERQGNKLDGEGIDIMTCDACTHVRCASLGVQACK